MSYIIMKSIIGQPKTSDAEYMPNFYKFDDLPQALESVDTLNRLFNDPHVEEVTRFYVKEVKTASFALAERIINIDYWGAMDSDATPETVAEFIENNPKDVINYLLEVIEDLQA